MNTKVLVGIVIAGVALATAYFFSSSENVPTATQNVTQDAKVSTTTETKGSKQAVGTKTQPTFTFGTSTTNTSPAFAKFDSVSFTSTSTYPIVTGTASTKHVGIVINNSKDTGLVGTWEIPVTNGHWSYSVSVALPPGTYTALLFIGMDSMSSAKIIVSKP